MSRTEDPVHDAILCGLRIKSALADFHHPGLDDPGAPTTDRLTLFLLERGILPLEAYDPGSDHSNHREVLARVPFGDGATAHLERRGRDLIAAISMPSTIIARGKFILPGMPRARILGLQTRLASDDGLLLSDVLEGLPPLAMRRITAGANHVSMTYHEDHVPWPVGAP